MQGTEDMRQLYASVHDDLKALAAAGLAEQCHTLHEWRLTDTGEAFCPEGGSGKSTPNNRPSSSG